MRGQPKKVDNLEVANQAAYAVLYKKNPTKTRFGVMKNIFLKKIGVNFSPLKKRRKFLGALWRFFILKTLVIFSSSEKEGQKQAYQLWS